MNLIGYITVDYLTIIPRARMGYESIAHDAEGRMSYWLTGYEGERSNCFSKIQLVGQKNVETKYLSQVKARHQPFFTAFRRPHSFCDVKWPVLQLCGRRDHMMTNVKFCLLIYEGYPMKRWFQSNSRIVKTHFASVMTLNNWEMIAETRSYIFRWRSRCRRRRVCVNSLIDSQRGV